MTDKRFIIDDAGSLIDMHTRDTFDYVSDVCDLLNEQYETIQQLQHDASILIQANQDYRKENEQLKQRDNRLEEKIQRERRVSAKQHLKWSKEAETKIKELLEENEQLKQQLTDCEKFRHKVFQQINQEMMKQ